MTSSSHIARLYVLVAGLLLFFVLWATVAAHPWGRTAAQDPRIAALAARQQQIALESRRVKLVLDRRFAAYRAALRIRQSKNAAAAAVVQTMPVSATVSSPAVRVVNLPPLVVTRTS